MIVRQLEFDRFRNLEKGKITFTDGINVIYGENAQGKTNILEAIWLFSGAKSFRGAKDSELIAYDETSAELKMDFFAEKREQTAKIRLGENKSAELNGVSKSAPSKFGGVIKSVIFSPDHLSLIKDGPAERRAFLDLAINQLSPSYAGLVSKYNRAVTQRNSVLKDMRFNAGLDGILDAYERQIALIGMKIVRHRKRYIELINKFAPEIYRGISGGREEISIEYITAAEDEDKLCEMLFCSRNDDISSGITSVGPHRDDIEVNINGHSARRFGSQGQQRSCVLTLKLCEAAIIFDNTGEQPIILLDDVMSELDEMRQDYVLNHIGERQVFITCCDINSIARLKVGKGIKVENGRIAEE